MRRLRRLPENTGDLDATIATTLWSVCLRRHESSRAANESGTYRAMLARSHAGVSTGSLTHRAHADPAPRYTENREDAHRSRFLYNKFPTRTDRHKSRTPSAPALTIADDGARALGVPVSHRRWNDAEAFYFTHVRPAARFDLVVPQTG